MSHQFGNIDSWTQDKLAKIASYLDAYLIALKKQNFALEYIDAFAGTGYVTRKVEMARDTLFDDNETVYLKDFIDGSARIALQTIPSFSRYTFIEKHRKRCKELESLKAEFPHLASLINVVPGDANEVVQELCSDNWITDRHRAVMFLDPYGTQVTWETIAAIADTQAIDLWILFPIGTVNRLLNRDGRIIPARKLRLDRLFGEDEWFRRIYRSNEINSLFSTEPSTIFTKDPDPFGQISRYFISRLKSVFADVAPNPLVMKNSNNSPIFLLCFAAGNPKGAPIAVRIAQHILGKK
jgi:three-Cys-motif partner protein